jgi:hypothetical protein
MRQKMLRARVRRIRRHLIEIVRQEGGNEYLEGSGRYGAEYDSPICLPITLKDDRFQYYNLSVLEDYGQQTVYTWKNFRPDTDSESDEEESTQNETESDDTDSNFDIADDSATSDEFEETEEQEEN